MNNKHASRVVADAVRAQYGTSQPTKRPDLMVSGPYVAMSESRFHPKTGSDVFFYVAREDAQGNRVPQVQCMFREAAERLADALNLQHRLAHLGRERIEGLLSAWPELVR